MLRSIENQTNGVVSRVSDSAYDSVVYRLSQSPFSEINFLRSLLATSLRRSFIPTSSLTRVDFWQVYVAYDLVKTRLSGSQAERKHSEGLNASICDWFVLTLLLATPSI